MAYTFNAQSLPCFFSHVIKTIATVNVTFAPPGKFNFAILIQLKFKLLNVKFDLIYKKVNLFYEYLSHPVRNWHRD